MLNKADFGKAHNYFNRINDALLTAEDSTKLGSTKSLIIKLARSTPESLFWDYCAPFAACDNDRNERYKDGPDNRLRRVFGANIIIKTLISGLIITIQVFKISVFRLFRRYNVLIIDDGNLGFRYSRIRAIYQNKYGDQVLIVRRISSSTSLKEIFSPAIICIGFSYPSRTVARLDFDQILSMTDQQKIEIIIRELVRRGKGALVDYFVHKYFYPADGVTVVGLDQIDSFVGVVHAVQSSGGRCIGFQHGTITRFTYGAIGHQSFKTSSVVSLNLYLVWGSFWRDFILANSMRYSPEQIKIAGSIYKADLCGASQSVKQSKLESPKTILMPFEFLAIDSEISEYIENFLALGFNVKIKDRPLSSGEGVGAGFDNTAYFVNRFGNRISIISHVTNEDLEDCFAVTMTHSTFALQIAARGIPIWLLSDAAHLIDVDQFREHTHIVDLESTRTKEAFNKKIKGWRVPPADQFVKDVFNSGEFSLEL